MLDLLLAPRCAGCDAPGAWLCLDCHDACEPERRGRIQADQLGVSMSKVLRIQSEQLRQDRRQRAEEKAARAPILIMLPTVGCIFPSLFIVILAPAALSAMSSCAST